MADQDQFTNSVHSAPIGDEDPSSTDWIAWKDDFPVEARGRNALEAIRELLIAMENRHGLDGYFRPDQVRPQAAKEKSVMKTSTVKPHPDRARADKGETVTEEREERKRIVGVTSASLPVIPAQVVRPAVEPVVKQSVAKVGDNVMFPHGSMMSTGRTGYEGRQIDPEMAKAKGQAPASQAPRVQPGPGMVAAEKAPADVSPGKDTVQKPLSEPAPAGGEKK